MVVRWQFFDGSDDTTVVADLNPDAMTMPTLSKTMTYTNTAGPGGNVLAFEGRDQVTKGSFAGTILTQAHYDQLVDLYNRRHQLQLTDDNTNVYTIYITDFQPTRVRVASNPNKYTYTINYIILDWPS